MWNAIVNSFSHTGRGLEYVTAGVCIVFAVISFPLWIPFWVIGYYYSTR